MRATLRSAVDRLVAGDLDHESLRAEANDVLRRHLAFDIAVWATLDPVTVVWTHCLLDGAERDHALERRTFELEFSGDDVCSLTSLVTGTGIGTIDAATNGDPSRSARFRELLGPMGMRDELRAVLTDGDAAWGALHLLRSGRPFTADEVEAVRDVTAPLASALRRSLVRAAVRSGGLDDPPGLIELGVDGAIGAISPEASALMNGFDVTTDLPQVIDAVVARRNAGVPAVASLATSNGWLSFQATSLDGRTAVIVEPIRPRRLAEIIVRTHGLTAREREVVELVARGSSTRAIARALGISEWTVQDHLKSVFAKFGVASRQELVAAVFFGHYLPMHDAGATPSPRGWYLADGARC